MADFSNSDLMTESTVNRKKVRPLSYDAMHKYYLAASKIAEEEFSFSDIHKLYEEGLDIWNSLDENWEHLKKTNPTLIDKYKEGVSECDPLSSGPALLGDFLSFAKKNGQLSKHIRINVGEGNSVVHSDGLIPPNSTVDMICGPIMIRTTGKSGRVGLNNFIYNTMERSKRDNITLNLYANKLISYTEGFAGYFHTYITGNAVLFEDMHILGVERSQQSRFIIDEVNTSRLNAFYDKYIEMFTVKVPVDNNNYEEVADFFNTYEYLNYKRVFSGKYVQELVERIV